MILDDIVAHKRTEVAQARRRVPEETLRRSLEGRIGETGRFRTAIDARLDRNAPPPVRLIAEVKKASPSKGVFREDFDHVSFAKIYQGADASALSVLTDERYFAGSLDILRQIAAQVDKPILRKEFVIDTYQLIEAADAGAAAVLLIVAVLGEETKRFVDACATLGLDALVEVHDETELEIALAAGASIVGVNNRDLRTFEVDLATSERLAGRMPVSVTKVAESGVGSRGDVLRLESAGFQAILVGETLVRSENPAATIRTLLY